jgi:hypothetical protein
MKKFFVTIFVVTLIFGLVGMADVYAFNFDPANNITIWDKMGEGTGWHGAQEDNEVEPPDVAGQEWDLEAFFLAGTELTMVGGFDFVSGEDDPYRDRHYYSGDIFIDVDGDAKYGYDPDGAAGGGGWPNPEIRNSFGYDYVLDLDFVTLTYNIYAINADTQVYASAFNVNQGSNPWRYSSGGTLLGSGTILYQVGLTDSDVGLVGGIHNAVAVDLGFLGADINNFTAHFTMQCGNDDLIGQHYDPIPEPSTVLLLGAGLIGLLAFGRKRFNK